MDKEFIIFLAKILIILFLCIFIINIYENTISIKHYENMTAGSLITSAQKQKEFLNKSKSEMHEINTKANKIRHDHAKHHTKKAKGKFCTLTGHCPKMRKTPKTR